MYQSSEMEKLWKSDLETAYKVTKKMKAIGFLPETPSLKEFDLEHLVVDLVNNKTRPLNRRDLELILTASGND